MGRGREGRAGGAAPVARVDGPPSSEGRRRREPLPAAVGDGGWRGVNFGAEFLDGGTRRLAGDGARGGGRGAEDGELAVGGPLDDGGRGRAWRVGSGGRVG